MKKILKIVCIVIASLAFIVMVPPIFMASSYTASSSIVINSTQYNVFGYFADLRKWEKWSPWKVKDTTTKYIYSNNTYGAGSTMEWDSKNEELGTGKLTTVQFKKFQYIHYKLEFIKPFKSKSGGEFKVEKLNPKQVKVTWTDKGKLKWPLDRWFNTIMNFKKMIEKDFNQGLENLKILTEKEPQNILPNLKPEKILLPNQLIFSIMHETVLNTQIGEKIGQSYGTILKTIETNKAIPLKEPPVCLFYNHNRLTSKMRPGIMVQGCVALKGEVECMPIKEGNTLRFAYYGGYSNLEPTYDAIDVYLEENKIATRENYTWESYVTDPSLELDSTKWLTYIYVPIK